MAIRIQQCLALAQASNCPRRNLGALLVDPKRNVVLMDGFHAIVCLMTRGVGEATAQRISSRGHNTVDSLLESIHHAEIDYARTRRFWG